MGKFYNDIMEGLTEALADANGSKPLKKETIEIIPVKSYGANEIKKIRNDIGFTQSLFAGYLGVSQKTVEAWESGKNGPSGAASRLLNMMEIDKKLPDKYQFIKKVNANGTHVG